MSNVIKPKHGSRAPTEKDLEDFELGYYNGALYIKDKNKICKISGGSDSNNSGDGNNGNDNSGSGSGPITEEDIEQITNRVLENTPKITSMKVTKKVSSVGISADLDNGRKMENIITFNDKNQPVSIFVTEDNREFVITWEGF